MAIIAKVNSRKATANGTVKPKIGDTMFGIYAIEIDDKDRGRYFVYLNDFELADLLKYWLNNEANASANVVNSFLSTT